MMATDTTDALTNMFKQTGDVFSQACSAGLKLQEETKRFWQETWGKSVDQAYTQAEKISREMLPAAKKNVQQLHRMFNEQGKRGLDAVGKSFESTEASFDDGIADRNADLWRTTYQSMRSGLDTMVNANAKMLENWGQMTRNCCDTACGKSTPKNAPNK